MYATVPSAALHGVEALRLKIECHVARGVPKVVITGLADAAIREAVPRIFSATRLQGIDLQMDRRIVVNLVPGDLKKSGSAFDLPIALGILAAGGRFDPEALSRTLVIGELNLNGRVEGVRGALVLVGANPEGLEEDTQITQVMVPPSCLHEAVLGTDLPVCAPPTLRAALDHFTGKEPLPMHHREDLPAPADVELRPGPDLREVKGQHQARRALEIAAAGGHNLLMVGSPGSGKTMLAHRLPGILPPLEPREALEVSKVHSVAGLLGENGRLLRQRPFRAPHASISDAGLLGAARPPHVGEISLAHRGVLFLDEFPEFRRSALEHLRQPLEDGVVHISRAALSIQLPARITLVAAMNPCPCGFHGDPARDCRCSPPVIERYRSRLSGPILDRIDLQVDVPSLQVEELVDLEEGEDSATVRARVSEAVARQQFRYREEPGVFHNGGLDRAGIHRHCVLDEAGLDLLRRAAGRFRLSARTVDRVIRMARTIADLKGEEALSALCLREALSLRLRTEGGSGQLPAAKAG